MDRFCFLDRISEVKRGESLTAFFTLKGSEEFLKDHFKTFPVMPGVLMLETLKQACAALAVLSDDFQVPFYRLAHAEGIKFGTFVRPGDSIRIDVGLVKTEGVRKHFEAKLELTGDKGGKPLKASLVLEPVECTEDRREALRQNARRFYEAIPASIA